MTLRKVERITAMCDLCMTQGPVAEQPEYAEQFAESVGITRFLGGSHCCSACREMLSGEVEKTSDVKVKKAVKA